MALPKSAIGYCGNVHPARNLSELIRRLEAHAVPLADRLGRPFDIGLWLPRVGIPGLTPTHAETLVNFMADHGLVCRTMNAFPFGDFHAKRVKEGVYRPDWTDAERSDYTCRIADLLVLLLPEGGKGSISTLPCGYRRLLPGASLRDFFPMILETVRHLGYLAAETGRKISLAFEPEPGCLLETTADAIEFVKKLRQYAIDGTLPFAKEDERLVMEHVGICFDVCHAAVMFEDPAASIRKLAATGTPIVKVQLSAALELPDPDDAEAREELARFVEPKYFHQTVARHPAGALLFLDDLTAGHAEDPPEEWLECPRWRTHFHVPVHESEIGPLKTTSPLLGPALAALAELPNVPDIEVETYTWSVLLAEQPAADPVAALNDGLERELRHVRGLVAALETQA
ncbi:MAG TPA: metabolite traffic protein EboE [Planctomycetia bacterium]|nr:metabolite traffic protein EboE [Planctomycetia bacterium]